MPRVTHLGRLPKRVAVKLAGALDSLTGSLAYFDGPVHAYDATVYHAVGIVTGWHQEDIISADIGGGQRAWRVKCKQYTGGQVAMPPPTVGIVNEADIAWAYNEASTLRATRPDLGANTITGASLIAGAPSDLIVEAIPGGAWGGQWVFGRKNYLEDPALADPNAPGNVWTAGDPQGDNWPFRGQESAPGNGDWWRDNPEESTDSPAWAYSPHLRAGYQKRGLHTWYPAYLPGGGPSPWDGQVSAGPGDLNQAWFYYSTVLGSVSLLGLPWRIQMAPEGAEVLDGCLLEVSAVEVERTQTTWTAGPPGSGQYQSQTTTSSEGLQILLMGYEPLSPTRGRWLPLGATVEAPPLEGGATKVVDATQFFRAMLANRHKYVCFGVMPGLLADAQGQPPAQVGAALLNAVPDPVFSYDAQNDIWYASQGVSRVLRWRGVGFGKGFLRMRYPGALPQTCVLNRLWPPAD